MFALLVDTELINEVAATISVPFDTRIVFSPDATDTPVWPETLTVTAPVVLL